MTDTLMRLPAVTQATGYSRSSIYSLMKRKVFPAPVRLAGGGAVAWRSSEVAAWIAAQGQQQADKVAA